MIQKTRSSQKRLSQLLLFIVIILIIPLSSCGENQGDIGEEFEEFMQEDWGQEEDAPKESVKEWWEDTKSEQNENLETGFDKFMNWLPDSIARLFGWEAEIQDDVPLPENFSTKKQALSAFKDKVPDEVVQYFKETEVLPLDEIRLRLAIIARAEAYPRNNIYDSSRNDQFGYRTDSAGYVSYVWQLEKSIDTTGMIAYSGEIATNDLKPGDALNNKRYASAGHIVLFSHWVDFDAKTFEAYHMNTTANGVTFNLLELIPDPKIDGAWTIKGIGAEGPFYPYRLNGFILQE